jgi:tRNA synthetases class I (E and Q), anti-codon binding domain.
LKIIENALIEPAVITEKPDVRFQFEREGYFYADPIDYSNEKPVFNKIVGLKGSSSKKKKAQKQTAKAQPKKLQIDGEVVPMSTEEQALFDTYTNKLKLNSEVANTLARDAQLSAFYQEALKRY